VSKQKVGTKEFGQAVLARLGQKPEQLKAVAYKAGDRGDVDFQVGTSTRVPEKKELVGVDVFVDWTAGTADQLGEAMTRASVDGLQLTMIANRGVGVWPEGQPETFCSDQWRCRYMAPGGGAVKHDQIVSLLQRVTAGGFDFIKTENLYNFNGEPGYSLGQGE
jgi:isocitrate dehydrogenase